MSRRWVILVVLTSSIALIAGCGDPPTKVGDVCQIPDHCGGTEGTFALTCDTSIPGGACMVEGCIGDDPLTEANEDDGSCPDGSRCVKEVECPDEAAVCFRCRRTCDQQSDCGEVIVCRERCETVDNVEKCSIECKNEMECTPFWSPLLESDDCDNMETSCLNECGEEDQACEDICTADKKRCNSRADDPPRACILKGRLYKPPEG